MCGTHKHLNVQPHQELNPGLEVRALYGMDSPNE